MSKKGILIIFSGPSGVGKGKVCKRLLKYDELNLVYSISVTTRKRRNNEVDGVDYFFVSKKEFFQLVKNNEFLEYAKFVDNYYGTLKSFCERKLLLGKNVLLEIEVQGAIQVMKKVPNTLSIFLIPPNLKELENRIRKRNSETEDILQQRLKRSREELLLQFKYNYIIINNTLNESVNNIFNIIKNEIIKRNM